jgi:hypothetical protein
MLMIEAILHSGTLNSSGGSGWHPVREPHPIVYTSLRPDCSTGGNMTGGLGGAHARVTMGI